MMTFNLYLAFHIPDLFDDKEFLAVVQQEPLFSRAKQFSKPKFFAEFLPDASSIYAKIASASG